MTILPKFLYLLQALPIHIPAEYFIQEHSAFITFLWPGKKPRLHKKILSLLKQYGGLAMPEIRTYYHAIHLSRLVDWCRHKETKLWPQIEQAQSETPLHRAPWCHTALPSSVKHKPPIGNTIKICAQLLSQSILSQFTPVSHTRQPPL